MNIKKILVCGGDVRSIYMAEFFEKQNFCVKVHALDNLSNKYSVKKGEFSDIKEAEVVVFGLPAVKNDMTLNAPMCDAAIEFESILNHIEKNALVAGGRFSNSANELIKRYGLKSFDYSTDEIFQIENAFYTAEGAVETIIRNTEKSVSELKMLIMGYGRISKALCKMLSAFNCDITVYARKEEQRAWAAVLGNEETQDITNLKKYDVIINTIPHELLFSKELDTVRKDALVIDLSARPGYVDAKECEKRGIKLIFLPGLPATAAPCSAGEAAARAIIRKISEI